MKSVFITGAASGIGLATARRFASEGWFVGLYDIDGKAVEQQLSSGGFPEACGGTCDVTDRESVKKAFAQFAEATGGRMDVLINNAGVCTFGPFESNEGDAHDAVIGVNVMGLTNVAQLAFPLLKETPDSTLINISSLSSVHGTPLMAVYSASKFYVNGLSEALGIEWAEHGIRVLVIKPSLVSTSMLDGMPEQLMKSFTVDFSPEQVAGEIIKALAGSGDSYLLGWKAKAFGFLSKVLPGSLVRRLMMHLSGH